jgi:hypothetical protein
MHRSEHARNELVDSKALLDQRNKSGDAAFVGVGAAECVEDELLERLDLIL